MRATRIPAGLSIHQAAADLIATAPITASYVCVEFSKESQRLTVVLGLFPAWLPLVSHRVLRHRIATGDFVSDPRLICMFVWAVNVVVYVGCEGR